MLGMIPLGTSCQCWGKMLKDLSHPPLRGFFGCFFWPQKSLVIGIFMYVYTVYSKNPWTFQPRWSVYWIWSVDVLVHSSCLIWGCMGVDVWNSHRIPFIWRLANERPGVQGAAMPRWSAWPSHPICCDWSWGPQLQNSGPKAWTVCWFTMV